MGYLLLQQAELLLLNLRAGGISGHVILRALFSTKLRLLRTASFHLETSWVMWRDLDSPWLIASALELGTATAMKTRQKKLNRSLIALILNPALTRTKTIFKKYQCASAFSPASWELRLKPRAGVMPSSLHVRTKHGSAKCFDFGSHADSDSHKLHARYIYIYALLFSRVRRFEWGTNRHHFRTAQLITHFMNCFFCSTKTSSLTLTVQESTSSPDRPLASSEGRLDWRKSWVACKQRGRVMHTICSHVCSIALIFRSPHHWPCHRHPSLTGWNILSYQVPRIHHALLEGYVAYRLLYFDAL